MRRLSKHHAARNPATFYAPCPMAGGILLSPDYPRIGDGLSPIRWVIAHAGPW